MAGAGSENSQKFSTRGRETALRIGDETTANSTPPSKTGASMQPNAAFAVMIAPSISVSVENPLVQTFILPFGRSARERFSNGGAQLEISCVETQSAHRQLHHFFPNHLPLNFSTAITGRSSCRSQKTLHEHSPQVPKRYPVAAGCPDLPCGFGKFISE